MFSKLKDKIKSWTKKISEKSKEAEPSKQKSIEPPMKFNAGVQKFEPDLEKIEEVTKEKSFLE